MPAPSPSTVYQMESRTLPAPQVRENVQDYLARAQLTQVQLAERIDYSHTALNAFLRGRHIAGNAAASDVRIRTALTDYMAANPVELPTDTLGRLYETANVKLMRGLFDSCLRDRSMAFCYGAPGSQKTWVFTHLVAEHNRRQLAADRNQTSAYYVYCSAGSRPTELLRKMCRAAAIAPGRSIHASIANLRWELHGRPSLFVLDEAQHLPIPTLEIVRELNDCEPHCGILLAGSHDLAQTFRERAAHLEQWNSRISAGVKLPGMTAPEAIEIIAAELGRQSPEQVTKLLNLATVADAYHDGPRTRGQKTYSYISARRLFNDLARIVADPRFAAAQPADFPAHYAQGATA